VAVNFHVVLGSGIHTYEAVPSNTIQAIMTCYFFTRGTISILLLLYVVSSR
jgi:hypothetical protein